LHLKKAVALNREVEFLPGTRELALGKNFGRGGDARSVTHFDSRRGNVAAACIDAGSFRRLLVEQILKLDLGTLETGRVHVREIVRDRVEVELLRLHPGRR
jgi:hypothetical protein